MLERLAGRVVTGPLAFLVSGLIDLALLLAYLARARRAGTLGSAGPRKAMLAVVFCGALLGALGALAGARPGTARASTTEPSILMDDYAFIYSNSQQVEQNLEQVASLGVNTIKVSMVWSLVAPDPNSDTEPDFDATNPSDYPSGAWDRYDQLVEDAKALGITVYFQLTAPAPDWAINESDVSGHEHNWSHQPNATDFEQFVQAVGERYSGSYPLPEDEASYAGGTSTSTSGSGSSSSSSGVLGVLGVGGTGSDTSTSSGQMIPAVHEWGIWNEPNEIGWLSPQLLKVKGKLEPQSPSMYRGLVNAGYKALVGTGHGLDTILIGETASGGKVATIPFLRDLYCVNGQDQPLTGNAAAVVGCPRSGSRRQFVIDNPGLFAITGWAHHPYSFNIAPNLTFKSAPSTIVIANIGVLERNIDRIFNAYSEPSGLPLYFTEWGYKTNPPNPYVRTNLLQQETWIDQGWYLTYLMPRVKAMAQEELYDQPPIEGKAPGSAAAWANFDSGLEFDDGSPKPSYDAFRLPIWIPKPKAGPKVLLWAELRPAQVDSSPVALLEYEAPGSSTWEGVTELSTSSAEGFIYTHVSIPNPGRVRLAWTDTQNNSVFYSRTVSIGR